MRHIIKLILLVSLLNLSLSGDCQDNEKAREMIENSENGDNAQDMNTPFDGGIALLVVGALGYGVKKVVDERNKARVVK